MLALTMILLLVLLSVVCTFRSFGYTGGDIRDYNSTGGANLSTLVKARGVSILNVGNSPLRFSKIGFYQTTDDAQSNQRELLGLNKTTVAFYTTGIANLLGDGVDIEPVGSYSEISNVSNISLLPGTALVIDFATDVSFRAVRLGKIDNFTDPTACRLQLSTSSLYQTIASAEFSVPKFMTFPSGDTQNNSFLKAGGLHVSPGGIFVVSTLSFRDIQNSGPAVKFALPSLARQSARQIARGQPAPAYGQATLANGTSGLFYPYYPTGDFKGPYYCYLGAVDSDGQRVLHPNQVPGSQFVKAGLVPASIYVPPGIDVADFPGKNGFFASSGFPINRVMQGDFTLVIKSDGTYPMCSFAWRSTPFDPLLACAFNNYDRAHWVVWGPPWGWDGAISGPALTTAGHYISNENGRHIVSNPLKWYWYRYQRSGNNLSVSYGSSLGSYAYTPVSAKCSTGDYVGCLIGAAGGHGTSHEIVSFTGNPYVA